MATTPDTTTDTTTDIAPDAPDTTTDTTTDVATDAPDATDAERTMAHDHHAIRTAVLALHDGVRDDIATPPTDGARNAIVTAYRSAVDGRAARAWVVALLAAIVADAIADGASDVWAAPMAATTQIHVMNAIDGARGGGGAKARDAAPTIADVLDARVWFVLSAIAGAIDAVPAADRSAYADGVAAFIGGMDTTTDDDGPTDWTDLADAAHGLPTTAVNAIGALANAPKKGGGGGPTIVRTFDAIAPTDGAPDGVAVMVTYDDVAHHGMMVLADGKPVITDADGVVWATPSRWSTAITGYSTNGFAKITDANGTVIGATDGLCPPVA